MAKKAAAAAANPFDTLEDGNGIVPATKPEASPLKEKTPSYEACQQALFELQAEIVSAGQQLEGTAGAYYILCDLASGRETLSLPRAMVVTLGKIMQTAGMDSSETIQSLSVEYISILRQLQALVNRANNMVDTLTTFSEKQKLDVPQPSAAGV